MTFPHTGKFEPILIIQRPGRYGLNAGNRFQRQADPGPAIVAEMLIEPTSGYIRYMPINRWRTRAKPYLIFQEYKLDTE